MGLMMKRLELLALSAFGMPIYFSILGLLCLILTTGFHVNVLGLCSFDMDGAKCKKTTIFSCFFLIFGCFKYRFYSSSIFALFICSFALVFVD